MLLRCGGNTSSLISMAIGGKYYNQAPVFIRKSDDDASPLQINSHFSDRVINKNHLSPMHPTSISPGSQQFVYLSFRLQLLLAHPNLRVLTAKKYPIEGSSMQQSIKSQMAVDVTDTPPQQLQRIRRGEQKGVIYRGGRVKQQVQFKGKKYKILLFKVGIMQLLPIVPPPTFTAHDFFTSPTAYDAIYLSPSSQHLSLFSHDYLLKSPQTQAQLEYQLEYIYLPPGQQEGDDLHEEQRYLLWRAEDWKCESCRERQAKYYCKDDKELFCGQCWDQAHRSQRKLKHRRQPLSPFNCAGKCNTSTHHGQKLQYYCFDCKELKCRLCVGDKQHAQQSVSKNLVDAQSQRSGSRKHQSIQTRQLQVLFKQKQRQLLQQAKGKLASFIREIQSKISLISSHYTLRHKELLRSFTERVAILQQQTTTELNKALTIQIELKKKYDEFLWMGQFVEHIQQGCQAITSIRVKEGMSQYVERVGKAQYFARIDKRIGQIKIFG